MGTEVGYSGTPLPKKLGIAAGRRVLLVGAPEGFALGPLPDGVDMHREGAHTGEAGEGRRGQGHGRKGRGGGPTGDPYDVVLAFCPDAATLLECFERLARRITPAGALWISWPKRSSGVATDLTENVVREVGLDAGLVDVKVAAVDATWSGLKFVYRRADRPR